MALLSLSQCLLYSLTSLLTYLTTLSLYRLYFHPLSRFPGPRLAALTQWYEHYHSLILDGAFLHKIAALHEQYGPIVRIAPNELHIRDPHFFSTIYSGGAKGKVDKDEAFVRMAGAPSAGFSTREHELHRARRGALNPFFSKRHVVALERRVKNKVLLLRERLKEWSGTGKPVQLIVAISAFTTDVTTEFAYGTEGCTNYLLDAEFEPAWAAAMQNIFENTAFRRAVPWTTDLLQSLPPSFALRFVPGMEVFIHFQSDVHRQVEQVVRGYNESGDRVGIKEGKEQDSLFHALLGNPNLPPSEKSTQRLVDEAEIIVPAGTDTTARTVQVIAFYVLHTPGVLRTVREELVRAMPERDVLLSWTELEKLPYLTAVIQEGLRLTFGVSTRSPRVHHEEVRYGDWIIPARVSEKPTRFKQSTLMHRI